MNKKIKKVIADTTVNLNYLKRDELEKIVKNLSAQAESQLLKIDNSKIGKTLASEGLRKRRGLDFSFLDNINNKKLTLNELRAEFSEVKQYLENRTSTIQGQWSLNLETQKRIHKELVLNGSDIKLYKVRKMDMDLYWELHQKFMEMNESTILNSQLSSSQVQSMVMEKFVNDMDGKSLNDILNELKAKIDNAYEKVQLEEPPNPFYTF